MATGWLRGVVKEVPNGDTLVIVGNVASGPPPEKRITLASLVAPRMGRRDGAKQDEAFAWQSREFLRKKAIGQAVTFKVDYTLANVPGMEFGSAFITDKAENLAAASVAAGWAKLRTGGGQQSPYYEELQALQEAAETQKLGLWTTDAEAVAGAVRKPAANLNEHGNVDAAEVLASAGKGKPLPCIVERVGNMASSLNITLLPDLRPAAVLLAGVQAPSLMRRPAPTDEVPDPEPQPEPFSQQAKHLSEMRVLNREVRLILEGVDKHDNLIGRLMYVGAGEELVDLGTQLVTAGLAKTTEWGLNMMTTGAQTLREAERKARQGRVAMWANYVPRPDAPTKLHDEFAGTVTEVVSGDNIVVRDRSANAERRLFLSSIRAPKLGRRDDPRSAEPYAREAREMLRQRLIGQEVKVFMEYDRKTGGPAAPDGAASAADTPERTMSFATIVVAEAQVTYMPPGAKADVNVAELLVARGLASVVRHRSDDERSAHYEALLLAEERGKKERKGLHSAKEPPVQHVNDMSLPGSANKAKALLPSFQRMGKVSGVVEYVLSGHRLKVFVPKEGVTVLFCPSGVRTPQRGQPMGRDGKPVKEEPFGEEAFLFMRQLAMQRNVEMEIETVDRSGTFLGRLRVLTGGKSVDVATALLTAGLAKLHGSFRAAEQPGGPELEALEQKAKDARLKVWEKYDPEAEAAAVGEDADSGAGAGEKRDITVTEVVDGSHFWAQTAEDPRVAWLSQQLASAAVSSGSRPTLQRGDLCLAQFSGDGQWYRSKVLHADTRDPTRPKYSVHFVDWGNGEVVPGSKVRPIDVSLKAMEPQAQYYALAYVKAPGVDDELGDAAGAWVARATGGGATLAATVVSTSRAVPATKDADPVPFTTHVVLRPKAADANGDSSSGEAREAAPSLNEELLREGLARMDRRAPSQGGGKVVEALQAAQQEAFKGRRGLWEYGDPGDDSDDEPTRRWGR